MMQEYTNLDIQELPLRNPYFHSKVESFLAANGLRLETLDSYYTLQNEDGKILAGAGLCADVIKGLAVSEEARSEGFASPLLSHIISVAASRGITHLKVFTKPEHQAMFESLGFRLLASAPEAILLENGRGLEQYCDYLRSLVSSSCPAPTSPSCPAPTGHPSIGVVVMNANPFTLGHKYLLETAAARVDRLVVIPVAEDISLFPYSERIQMIRSGAPEGVIVAEGSGYQISALTFPTYFLKDLSTAAETQMRLDIDLFARHIAPALGATVRFVGSEPYDELTARYNELMKERLCVVEVPRLETPEQVGGDVMPGSGVPVMPGSDRASVSASAVRAFLSSGNYAAASALVPPTSRPYLLAHLACEALQRELDCPMKPGLVGPDSAGAHADMNYALMKRSIQALRPWFVQMAMASSPAQLQKLGLSAEKAMLEATGGVNTHKGAIFCLGLALYARKMEFAGSEDVMQKCLCEIAQTLSRNSLSDSNLHFTHGEKAVNCYGVKGAREMAQEGYKDLWADWLPFYRSMGSPVKPGMTEEERHGRLDRPSLQKTLLRIMSTLDDTCVIHRVGYERAQEVKRESAGLLEHFSEDGLQALCQEYAAQGISPGGAADMLALTLFMDTIITH